jgi:STE24 endopeptidase
VTWGKLAVVCAVLGALQVALTLYATHAAPRKYREAEVLRYFSAGYLQKAADYRQARLAGQRVLLPLGVALPLIFVFAGPLVALSRRLIASSLHPVAQAVVIVGALVVFGAVLALPFRYVYGYGLERHYGFSRQTPLGWLGDQAKGLAIGLVVAAVVTAAVVLVYRALPQAWPWVAGAVLSALTVFFTLIFPWVVEPLFHDYHDLGAGSLRSRIETLLRTERLEKSPILVMKASAKTSRTNAYVSGLWGSHRVVLFDTLLEKNTEDEVISVVAHELGHSAKNHVALGVLLGIGGIAVGVFCTVMILPWLLQVMPLPVRPDSPGPILPLLLVLGSLVSFFVEPAGSWLSQRMESQADRYALDITRAPAAAISMEKKLAEDNLADPNPRGLAQVWFGSHPDTVARIQMAEAWPGWPAPH